MSRLKRVWMVVLLCSLFILSSILMTATADLPSAPDHTAIIGPFNVSGKQSFQGGILLVPADPAAENPSFQNVNEYILTIEGAGEQTKQWTFKSIFGQSISGPIAKEEANGILQAIETVRPPKSYSISATMTGQEGYITVWTLAKVVYDHNHYAIYHITQTNPTQTQELIGYINVEVPIRVDLTNTTTPIIDASFPTPTQVQNGPLTNDLNGTLLPPQGWLPLPDDGLGPFIGYGHIDVYDYWDDELWMCTDVRPGETVQMWLPEGDYDVEAEVSVFGIPFEVNGGHPSSDYPFKLEVTLIVGTLVYGIIGGFILLAVAIAAIVGALLWRRHKKNRKNDDSVEPPKLDFSDEEKPPPKSVLDDIGPVHSPPA